MSGDVFRAGFVALVGRPNVGKSTLLNAMLDQKISIVTPKPQTTRHRVLGVKSTEKYQIIFVDTPGVHDGSNKLMNRSMNRVALNSLEDADLVVFVVDAKQWTTGDDQVCQRIVAAKKPTILVCNKIDRINDKTELLPILDSLAGKLSALCVVPISALKRDGIDALEKEIAENIPESQPLYPAETVTDRSNEFLISELIREKLTLRLQQELPYGITVMIEKLEKDEVGLEIAATVLVEKDSQKAIVIGKGGQLLKQVGRSARLELKERFQCPVHLSLWVKVKENWSDNARALESMGFELK
ncbi:MAG: GTPase Era [Pseudomonadota bacterium]